MSVGFFNATVYEPNPARALALVERVQALHDGFGQEPAVREPLARALASAYLKEKATGERGVAEAAGGRFRALADRFGHEPTLAEIVAQNRAFCERLDLPFPGDPAS